MKNTKQKSAKTKTVNKADLIRTVRAKGFSARKSAKALNAILDSWKFALWCGEDVEVPGGTLQAVITKGTERPTLQVFRRIDTKELLARMLRTPGRRRVVKMKADPTLGLKPDPPLPPPPPPPPPPPKPETAEEIAERQLVTELLGLRHPADDQTMALMRAAVGAHPRIPGQRLCFTPGALLRRLRKMKNRGWRFYSAADLAQQVSEYHWL